MIWRRGLREAELKCLQSEKEKKNEGNFFK